jgi:D,D-heptose 1,7-bisphosphate phosphatase
MSNKAIFLDRDSTLIEDPGYISHPDQVKLLDGVDKSLIEFKNMGYKLIIVSNQSGVARGIVSEQALNKIHNRLKQLLLEKGAPLDKIYYCPYHPEAVIEKYRKESDWRKPNPGMLLAAADEMGIDLSQSWMIGNSSRDVEAGLKAGCKTILINHPSHYSRPKLGEPNPDYNAVNIREAVNIVKKHHRSTGENLVQNPPLPQIIIKPLPQTAEEPPQPQSTEPKSTPAEKNVSGGPNPPSAGRGERTEQLLESILEQLKSIRRSDMFVEFSITRFMAGLWQSLAWFCLLISIGVLMYSAKQVNLIFITLGFALVFQVMAMTFYIMHGRK